MEEEAAAARYDYRYTVSKRVYTSIKKLKTQLKEIEILDHALFKVD